MSNAGSVIVLDDFLRDPSKWVGQEVRVRGMLQASSEAASLVSSTGSIPIEGDKGTVAIILIRGGIAPFVGGPFLFNHEVIVNAVCCRSSTGGYSLHQIRQIAVCTENAVREKVIIFP